jgi:hypothetical protein
VFTFAGNHTVRRDAPIDRHSKGPCLMSVAAALHVEVTYFHRYFPHAPTHSSRCVKARPKAPMVGRGGRPTAERSAPTHRPRARCTAPAAAGRGTTSPLPGAGELPVSLFPFALPPAAPVLLARPNRVPLASPTPAVWPSPAGCSSDDPRPPSLAGWVSYGVPVFGESPPGGEGAGAEGYADLLIFT